MTEPLWLPLPHTQGGRLWLLGAMPWSRDEDPEGGLIHRLRRELVDGVVVLAPCEEIRPAAGKDLLRWYRRQGFEPLHLPFPPDGVPPEEDLRRTVDTLRRWLSQGRHVVVHGHGERRRAAFFAVAWLILGEGWPPDAALDWLHQHWPQVDLAPAQRAWIAGRPASSPL